MIRYFILLFTVALAAPAQTNRTHPTRVWFKDGTCVEIHTEASGNAPLFAGGSVNVDSTNTMQRLVLDDHDHALFGYDVEARAVSPGTYLIRIRPLDTARPVPVGVFVAAGGRVSTIAAPREFSAVKSGEAVMVDILYNPATGEKIYDVLRPLAAVDDDFVFEEFRVLVNGEQREQARRLPVQGTAALLHLPDRGDYFLALEPLSGYPFKQIGRVDRGRLVITEGDDTIEIFSTANILKKDESRAIWVYHNRLPVVKHDVVSAVELQLQTELLRSQMEQMAKTYRPEHPEMKKLMEQLDELRASQPGKNQVAETLKARQIELLLKEIDHLSQTYKPQYPRLKELMEEVDTLNANMRHDSTVIQATDRLEELIQRRGGKKLRE
jgi:hypothetical protein